MANAAAQANDILGVAIRTVEDKITSLDSLSNKYNNQLAMALTAIGSVKIDAVLAPTRLQAPEPIPPSSELGQFPTFEKDALVIPQLPDMKDIDSILGNLDLPDLGPMPDAPQELALSTPQAPSIDTIYLPVRPDIDTTVSFPAVPTINNLVMPGRPTSNITIDIPVPPTINTVTMPTRPDISLDVNIPDAPTLDKHTLPDKPDYDLAITLPVVPVIDELNAPVRPDIDINIDVPEMPDIILPELEALEKIDIPDFVMPDYDLPVAPNNSSDLEAFTFDSNWWQEPGKYESEMLDQLTTLSSDMLSNPQNFGLPDTVVKALFDKPRERISAEVVLLALCAQPQR